jgi:hypothetical protein
VFAKLEISSRKELVEALPQGTDQGAHRRDRAPAR